MTQSSRNLVRIGLPGAGKQVYAVGRAVTAFRVIYAKHRDGNYWATVVLKELVRLTSGKLGHNHVYVKRQTFPGGVETFYLKLPGCEATVKELAGAYYISHLEANMDYFELQDSQKKPGLHYVQRDESNTSWTVNFLKKREVEFREKKFQTEVAGVHSFSNEQEDWALVSVGPPNESPLLAAQLGVAHIKASPYKDKKIEKFGFNMMYTPGNGSIGGCTNLKEAVNPEYSSRLMETSYLLADAMIKANKKQMKVAWVTHEGGSGYLTQAMSIVKSRGISLSTQTIYLSRPHTNPDKAYSLSKDLGMSLDAKLSNSNFNNINELAAGMASLLGTTTGIKRLKNDSNYKTYDFLSDGYSLYGSGGNLWKIGAAVGAAAAAYFGGLSAVVTAVGAGASVTIPMLIDNMRSVAQWPDNKTAVEEMAKPKLESFIAKFRSGS